VDRRHLGNNHEPTGEVPHFTLEIDTAGPALNAQVFVSEGRRAALVAENLAVPVPRVIRALVDTGASFTAVEPEVLQALGPTPTGTVDIVTPSTGQEVHTAETLDIDLVILKTPTEPPLLIPNLRVRKASTL
jgi:predicted aspartyl protease